MGGFGSFEVSDTMAQIGPNNFVGAFKANSTSKILCENAPLPLCNLFPNVEPRCTLHGVGIHGHKVGDLGTVFLDILAIFISALGIFVANRREASVGRREIQIVLGAYLLISLCDIFTTGRVLQDIDDYRAVTLSGRVLLGFTSCQNGLTVAFFWILLLSSIVGYQLIDDGTAVSLALILGSAIFLFTGSLYISLDTGFDLTGHFEAARTGDKSIALYVLNLGLPLICAVGYAVSQCFLTMKVLGEKKPLLYLLAAVFCFASGQALEFAASPFICKGTSGAIDGGFFQTLMSLAAMFGVFIVWISITDDSWADDVLRNPDYTSSQSTERWANVSERRQNWKRGHRSEPTRSFSQVYVSEPTPKVKRYQSIHIEKPVGISVNQGVVELNRYKAEFLDKVGREVWQLIKNSQKRDVTAIRAGGRVYRCFPPTSYSDGYVGRLKAMIRYKDNMSSETTSLPTYNGEELDSWLTQPITERIEKVYKEFFDSHADIRGKVMLEQLRNHPTAYREVAAQFVKSLRESGEPLTEEMCKGLIHFVSEQLSTHSTDQLGQQLGHALLHVGGVSVISTFASTLVHTMGSAVAKLAIKLAAKVTFKTALEAGGKMVAKLVVTGFVSSVATMFAAKGMGAAAAVILHLATPLIIAAIVAWELSEFTENLADRIAPEVREVMSGQFEKKNRSALDQIGRETLEDLAFQLGKTLALDSSLVEEAKEAAKEIAKAKLDALRH